MKIAIKRCLFEAYRRNEMFERTHDTHELSRPLTQRWTGLGYKSTYQPAIDAGFMRWHNGRQPPTRCMGWLCLTPAGITALESIREECQQTLDALKSQGYEHSYYGNYQLIGGL